jgi:hypothetical protein
MALLGQVTAAGALVKYKTSAGGSYAAIPSVISFEPDTLKAGVIKLKRALQDAVGSRWRKKVVGDPEAGMVKVTCVWSTADYALVKGWLDQSTQGLYFQLTVVDGSTTSSTWERIGFISEIDEPKATQSDEGGEEILWGFTIEITGEPTYVAGT